MFEAESLVSYAIREFPNKKEELSNSSTLR